MASQNQIQIRVPQTMRLPENSQWENRFQIRSESSNRLYTIAQHKTKRHWGCSCPAYLTRRKCKHLEAIGVPSNETPFEATLTAGGN